MIIKHQICSYFQCSTQKVLKPVFMLFLDYQNLGNIGNLVAKYLNTLIKGLHKQINIEQGIENQISEPKDIRDPENLNELLQKIGQFFEHILTIDYFIDCIRLNTEIEKQQRNKNQDGYKEIRTIVRLAKKLKKCLTNMLKSKQKDNPNWMFWIQVAKLFNILFTFVDQNKQKNLYLWITAGKSVGSLLLKWKKIVNDIIENNKELRQYHQLAVNQFECNRQEMEGLKQQINLLKEENINLTNENAILKTQPNNDIKQKNNGIEQQQKKNDGIEKPPLKKRQIEK